jgi:hypothetical protein
MLTRSYAEVQQDRIAKFWGAQAVSLSFFGSLPKVL